MLEAELFALFEQTADAAYTVSSDGEICSWNTAAERLLGYPAAEVIGRHIEDVFDAYDALGTEPLAGGGQAATRHWPDIPGGIPSFDLDVRVRSGARLWINVSTIVFDNSPASSSTSISRRACRASTRPEISPVGPIGLPRAYSRRASGGSRASGTNRGAQHSGSARAL